MNDPTQRTNEEKFRLELSKLAHLDKTGLVSKEDSAMHAHGGFCDVFIGTIGRDNLDQRISVEQPGPEVKVAIKRLRVHIYHEHDFLKPFVDELRLWSKLRHSNILPLFGYLLEGNYPSILSEWMENGTARRYVINNDLSVTELFSMFLGISRGVKYLHDNEIVHSDLKAENILISQSKTPLICDFGVSRMLTSSITRNTNSFAHGTMRWMAPELLAYDRAVSHTKATDIWALGMTYYELISKGPPFAETRMDAQVINIVLNLGVPQFPAHLSEWGVSLDCIWNVCLSCWHFCPEDRLGIKEVISAVTTCMEIVTATDAQVITISEQINQTLLDGMESRSSHLARHSSARQSMDPRRLSRSSTVILPESDSHRRRRLQLPQLNVEVGRTTFKGADQTIRITQSPGSHPIFSDGPIEVAPLRLRPREPRQTDNLLTPGNHCEPTSADSQRSDGPRGNITPQHAPPYELITSVRDQNATDTLQNWLATIPKPSPKSAPPRPFRPLPPIPVTTPKAVNSTPNSSVLPSTSREMTDSLPGVEVNGSSPSPKFKWIRGELLSKASYGRVYLALNASTGEMIIVKQIKRPINNTDLDIESQTRLNAALNREIDMIKDISHINIVQYLGLEQTPKYMSIFFEYAGDSLTGCLRKHGKFHDQVVRSFTAQILSGLEYLHKKEIVYQNLRPDKILVDHSGVCKISLFRLSARMGISTDATNLIYWTAPEVVQAGHKNEQFLYTDRTDIWGVGCIAYEMWTGRRPWLNMGESAASQMLLDSKAPPIPPDVKLGLEADDFRTKCFLSKPNRRPSAAKLRQHPYFILEPGWTFTEFV